MVSYVSAGDLADIITDEKDRPRVAAVVTGSILRHTRLWCYDTGPDGNPADEALRAAFRDAALAQATALARAGLVDAVLSGGATAKATVASSSSNGKSVTLDQSESHAGRARLLDGVLAPEAAAILATVGRACMPGVLP